MPIVDVMIATYPNVFAQLSLPFGILRKLML